MRKIFITILICLFTGVSIVEAHQPRHRHQSRAIQRHYQPIQRHYHLPRYNYHYLPRYNYPRHRQYYPTRRHVVIYYYSPVFCR